MQNSSFEDVVRSGDTLMPRQRVAPTDSTVLVLGETGTGAENVAEIGTLIEAEKKGSRIILDLTDLRSVDGEAVKFLEKWEADSIKLKNCGLYIREWIRRERLERESDQSLDK
jgi:hypothetical protein